MSLVIKDCPHCYTRVAFKEDGVCPACGKKPSDLGGDPSKTLLTIWHKSVLPPICIQCGSHTRQRVTITKRTHSRVSGGLRLIWDVLVLFLAGVIHGFLHLL